MQWNQTPCAFLRQDLRSVQNQEETLELRLPEGMPDIGKVLCAWGQVVVRSKQWRSDSIQMTGGVSAWVLYAPEEGGEPQSVACWLPLQAKWSLPETKREGTIRICPMLRSVDARLLSARKMMVRASVGILAEALEPWEAAVFQPPEIQEDVQLLEKTYPVTLPKEAGEKLFLMDEELSLPEMPSKLLAWDLRPMVLEQTVIGSRGVFKGECRLHLVYMDGNGKVKSETICLPFAQFAELDADYDKEATVSSMLAVSNLEPELAEDRLHLKAGILCQYVVYDCKMLNVCEDAYSPYRRVEPIRQEEMLPALLDRRNLSADIRQSVDSGGLQSVDTVFYPECPMEYREGEEIVIELPGTFQLLGYDDQGQLQAVLENTVHRIQVPAGEGCGVWVEACCLQGVQAMAGEVNAQVELELMTSSQQPISMVTGLEIGELMEPDSQRPALVLRKAEDLSLWELAKKCGSTVDAIRRANQLTAEPAPDRMLLIPVC